MRQRTRDPFGILKAIGKTTLTKVEPPRFGIYLITILNKEYEAGIRASGKDLAWPGYGMG
jgi:hypothetical protein